MGKRKNKNQDEDRIVQRKRFKKQGDEQAPQKSMLQQQEEEEIEISEEESFDSAQIEEMIGAEEEAANAEKTKAQKFLEQFKIEEATEVEETDHAKRLSKFANKIQVVTNNQTILNSYGEFFDKPASELIADGIITEVVQTKAERKSEKEQIREKMKEIFNIGQTEENIINPYKKQEAEKQRQRELEKDIKDPVKEALNNKVDIKEYQIASSLKSKKGYSVDNRDEFVVDALAAQKSLLLGLNCSTANIEDTIQKQLLSSTSTESSSEPQSLLQDKHLEVQFGAMNNYLDLVVIDKDEQNNEQFRKMYLSHIMNHITKAPLSKDITEEKPKEEKSNPQNNTKSNNLEEENDLDGKKTKGFTNCRILILTPFKGDAAAIVNELLQIYGEKKLKKFSKKERFIEEYDDPERAEEDDFRLGISITNKGLRMFTPFSSCDIIVASMVGLRMATGEKGSTERDYSFLSSVEVLVIDRAHALYMQNWEHMKEIMALMNKIPKHKSMTNSIHQIREYFFENMAQFYRQTLVYSEFSFPELNSLKARFMNNHKGSMQLRPFYSQPPHPKINQEFVKFEVTQVEKEMEERITFFKNKIWDDWNKEEMDKSVIFVSSYFEYVKLKALFVNQNAPVFGICEYTKKRDVQKRISLFKNGTLPILMQTERAFFFDVGSVRGMKNLLFFSLPKNQYIYEEMLSHLDQSTLRHSKCKVVVLFNKLDALALERIVGTENSKEFLADYNKSTSFVL